MTSFQVDLFYRFILLKQAERLGAAGQKTFITGRRQELLDEISDLYPGIIVGINLDPSKLEGI